MSDPKQEKQEQPPQQQHAAQGGEQSPSEEDVLEAIFNPNMPFGSATQEPKLHGPADAKEDTEEEKRMREKEREAVKLAEEGRLEDAITAFTKVIEEDPARASGYNNRAQVYQMKGEKELAMKDLDFAIDKCELSTRVAQQAYAQRGILKRLMDDAEGARKDLETAGLYGNAWARHEAVKLNPYAALCNQMLKEAVDALSGKTTTTTTTTPPGTQSQQSSEASKPPPQ